MVLHTAETSTTELACGLVCQVASRNGTSEDQRGTYTQRCAAHSSVLSVWLQLVQTCTSFSYLQLTMMDAQQQIGGVVVSVLECIELRAAVAVLALLDGCSVHLRAVLDSGLISCMRHDAVVWRMMW